MDIILTKILSNIFPYTDLNLYISCFSTSKFSKSSCCKAEEEEKPSTVEVIEDEAASLMHNAVGEHFGEDAFDKEKCKCVFDIIEVEQKFTSKQLYEKKFIWVQLGSRSIHMSEHNSKERRHKEASLSDVTDVVDGVPKKYKEGIVPAAEQCLTVVFRRGGGIDLKFPSRNERDIWHETLKKIVAQMA